MQVTFFLAGLFCTLDSFAHFSTVFASYQRQVSPEVIFSMGHDECLAGDVLDGQPLNALGSLHLNKDLIACLNGDGIEHISRFESPIEADVSSETGPPEGGFAYALSPFENLSTPAVKNMSFQVWLSVHSNWTDHQMAVIFSVGNESMLRLKLFQMNAKLFIKFTAPQGTLGADTLDISFPLPYNTPPTAICLVITAETNYISMAGTPRQRIVHRVYVNGVHNASENQRSALDGRLTYWDATDRLFFFSEPSFLSTETVEWSGRLFEWALYNRVLSPEEVAQNYAARVPNSPPIVQDASHVVQENGEVGSHYDTPEFYLSPVPVDELVSLTLVVLDGDHDPSSPSYNASASPITFPGLCLATLPANGTLYFMNGTAIHGSLPIALAVESPRGNGASLNGTFTTQLRFRPGWKEVSWPHIYTTFEVFAVDGVTGLASNTATISVYVKAVHQIPIAGNGSNHTNNTSNVSLVAMASRLTAVALEGIAYGGFRIVSARVASLPTHGYLYRVNDTNATSPLIVGDEILTAPAMPAQVAYFFTGPQTLPQAAKDNSTSRSADTTSHSMLGNDSFTYTVTDDFNTQSIPALVRILITPSLVALPAVPWPIVQEHTLTPITLFGADYQSVQRRDICFEITRLPHHGTLYTIAANGRVSSLDSVPFQLPEQTSSPPYDVGVTLHYMSDAGFFTWPNRTWNGTALFTESGLEDGFKFRVVSCTFARIHKSFALPSSFSEEQKVVVRN